jgi:hypothetical protein
MKLAKKIEVASEHGVIFLQDAWSWRVGRWAPEANGRIERDGTSQWTPLSDDVAAPDRERLLGLTPPVADEEAEQTQKRPLSPLILGLAIAIFCVGGSGFWIGPQADKSADQERDFSREPNRAYVAIGGLTAAREHKNVALTGPLESKGIASSIPGELKQGLEDSEARSEAPRGLASARENHGAARNLAAARERENASQKRAPTLERELTSARETAALPDQPSHAEVTARDAASSAGPLNRPLGVASKDVGSIPTAQDRARITAAEQTFSGAISHDTIAGASGPLTHSNGSQPGRPRSPSAISSAEEAKLVTRAASLIKQFDFASARLLLEYALDKGSARAAFMMAETYDWEILRSLHAFGMRGDAKLARKFYQLAATGGIEKARERVEALQSDANANTDAGGEERSR